jgi:hypothetical protein
LYLVKRVLGVSKAIAGIKSTPCLIKFRRVEIYIIAFIAPFKKNNLNPR